MLKQENRLKKVRDFNLLMDKGKWINSPNFSLKVLELAENRDYFPKNEDPDKFEKQLKIAFTVGLKVSRKAVERNRLKRQMREVVRLVDQEKGLGIGKHLLFVAKPSALGLDFSKISEEIKLLLKKAGC